MSTAPADKRGIDPNRYHEAVGDTMSPVASAAASCLHLCGQTPNVVRLVLRVGEPVLIKELPRIT